MSTQTQPRPSWQPDPLHMADCEADTSRERKLRKQIADLNEQVCYLREIIISQQREIEALKAQVRHLEEEVAWREYEITRNQPLASI